MATTVNGARPKALHIALWAAQGILALGFFMAGFMKVTQPIDKLATMMPFVADVSPAFVRFIGVSEVLGAIGLIIPAAFRVRPRLTGYAALGLLIVMVLALLFHLTRGEGAVIGPNIFLGAIAAFIAWGRFKKAPIY
ncbi:MAG TPA: DoxX family protein [Chryseolinea sp.]